jgi:hypothetical protein
VLQISIYDREKQDSDRVVASRSRRRKEGRKKERKKENKIKENRPVK